MELSLNVTLFPERVGRATRYQNRCKHHIGVTGRHQDGLRSRLGDAASLASCFCQGSPWVSATSHEHLTLRYWLLRKNFPSKINEILKKSCGREEKKSFSKTFLKFINYMYKSISTPHRVVLRYCFVTLPHRFSFFLQENLLFGWLLISE